MNQRKDTRVAYNLHKLSWRRDNMKVVKNKMTDDRYEWKQNIYCTKRIMMIDNNGQRKKNWKKSELQVIMVNM